MKMKSSIQEWITFANSRLSSLSEFSSIESMVLASHVTSHPREWIIAHPETEVTESQFIELESAITRLIDGEPLAYITGRRSFYGLDLLVDNRVLIPRPETELLVEMAIQWLNSHPTRRKVADIGTGSGAIAIAVAANVPDARILATDISSEALEVATVNARRLQVADSITFQQNDLLSGLNEKFDLLLSNLPYIPTADLNLLAVGKYEPNLALDGGADGLQLIQKLLDQFTQNALPGACIILEIQYNQANHVIHIAEHCYSKADITTSYDLAGLPRTVKIQL